MLKIQKRRHYRRMEERSSVQIELSASFFSARLPSPPRYGSWPKSGKAEAMDSFCICACDGRWILTGDDGLSPGTSFITKAEALVFAKQRARVRGRLLQVHDVEGQVEQTFDFRDVQAASASSNAFVGMPEI
jgi:hypothetical protein